MCLASTLRAPRAPDWLVHLAPSINFTHIEEVTHRPGTNKRAAANPLAHTRRAAPPPGLVPAARTDARDAYVVVPVAKASPPEELQPEPRRPRSRHPRSRRTCGSPTARHQQHRHGRQEATVAAVRAGVRAPVAGGEVLAVAGGAAAPARRRRANGAASAAGIATDARRRRAGGFERATAHPSRASVLLEKRIHDLQAEVQLSGLLTRLSCARRARQHGPEASAC